jgi:predicted nucleic acid-binding protein
MKKVLIDTDVILDFFFDRKPFSESATRILTLCETRAIEGFITPVIVSNVYYLLRQTAKHERIIEKLTLLISFLGILLIDKTVITSALNSGFKDFEDALQNFSAEHASDIDVILTRNIKDYKSSKLSVMTPDDFLRVVAS